MSHTDRLIENLVRLSGLRRRDDLLSGLTQALSETIDAHEVAIFSLVHDKDRRFWLPLRCSRPALRKRNPARRRCHSALRYR